MNLNKDFLEKYDILMNEDVELALEFSLNALKESNNVDFCAYVADCYMSLEDYDKAIEILKEALYKKCNNATYAKSLAQAIGEEAIIDGETQVIVWLDGVDTFSCDLTAGQVRIDSIVVQGGTIPAHVYDDEYDPTCNTCGAVRDVPEKPVEILYGDVNNDGDINVRDYGLLQQYLNDYDVTINLDAADVTGDGDVNVRDYGLLQQFLNDYDVTLGAG